MSGTRVERLQKALAALKTKPNASIVLIYNLEKAIKEETEKSN